MCGRFNNHLPKMHGWVDVLGDWPAAFADSAKYNVAPTTAIPIVTPGSDLTEWCLARWGMIPAWSKSFESKYATFNARTETVADKPSFRNAWNHQQRCLIPMAGYYEWRAGSQKQAFYVNDRERQSMLALGLYEDWQDQRSCTMLTRPAIDELQSLHPRMPVLATPELIDVWLSGEPISESDLQEAEQPYLLAWPVDSQVGNVRNQTPSLIDPIDL